MLLAQLRKYGAAHNEVPAFYAASPVRWKCKIRSDTRKATWERLAGEKGKPVEIVVPSVNRGNTVVALLLSDSAEYVLGFALSDRLAKAKKYHAAFEADLAAAVEIGVHPRVRVVADALPKLKPPPGMDPRDRIVFEVDGQLVTDLPEVQDYWADCQLSRVEGEKDECSCCGKHRAIVKTVTEWLRNVPTSLKGKCQLISANHESAEKYRREQSRGAALCTDCARNVARGLNILLDGDTVITAGKVVIVAWGHRGATALFYKALTAPTPELAADLRKLAETSKKTEPVHVLMLTAHQARAVVLDFQSHDPIELARHLATWIETQQTPFRLTNQFVEAEDGKKKFYPGLLNLLYVTGEVVKVPVHDVVAVVRAATLGEPLPHAMSPAVQKAVDRDLSEVAVAFWRLVNHYHPEDPMAPTFNPAMSVAYRCGELLATLERIQRAAVPNINRTVAEGALRSARMAPATVLSLALTNAKAHLAKLERHHRAKRYEAELEERLRGLQFPKWFTPEDQAAFCVGYFTTSLAKPVYESAKKEVPAAA